MTNLEPTMTPEIKRPKAGFNSYAERLNGRAAMIGFVAVVAIEYLTGKGFLTWLGLT
ncbi:MAG: chlorophyll a/b-binding protein [Cyanobacteria bacterium P01_H01_bin.162]